MDGMSAQMNRTRIHTLIPSERIAERIEVMGRQIAEDYAGQDLVLIGLLNGVYVFFADLTRAIDLDFEVMFMRAASYGAGTETSGEVKILQDLDRPLRGRHALLVEDIVDTGLTLNAVRKLILEREPASLKIATLLDKPSRRRVQVPVDYVGFTIEDSFVVGYGLDVAGKYRNLPYVGIYDPA